MENVLTACAGEMQVNYKMVWAVANLKFVSTFTDFMRLWFFLKFWNIRIFLFLFQAYHEFYLWWYLPWPGLFSQIEKEREWAWEKKWKRESRFKEWMRKMFYEGKLRDSEGWTEEYLRMCMLLLRRLSDLIAPWVSHGSGRGLKLREVDSSVGSAVPVTGRPGLSPRNLWSSWVCPILAPSCLHFLPRTVWIPLSFQFSHLSIQ